MAYFNSCKITMSGIKLKIKSQTIFEGRFKMGKMGLPANLLVNDEVVYALKVTDLNNLLGASTGGKTKC